MLQLLEASPQLSIVQCGIVNPTPNPQNEDKEILCVRFITFDLSGADSSASSLSAAGIAYTIILRSKFQY